MPHYRIYVLDRNDRVVGRHEIAYPTDDAAIAGAAAEFPDQGIEIWDGVRCVLTCATDAIDRSDAALHRPVNIIT